MGGGGGSAPVREHVNPLGLLIVVVEGGSGEMMMGAGCNRQLIIANSQGGLKFILNNTHTSPPGRQHNFVTGTHPLAPLRRPPLSHRVPQR